jgi:serine/threonine-protein kinase
VALKILRHLEPAAMVRFMHEAQLHARLDCPNICRIYDVDASNGAPRIAMQLVRGPTLEDASPDLSLDEIIAIMITVAEAIHAAHHLKLIHRDIKPSNILLQWGETGGWVPYICDFGLAMTLDGPSVTQPLAMTGTPAYMAPEQVRGDRTHICPATDVYGIGGTLYFTLTGRPPCVSTVTAEVLRVKRERRFPTPRSLEPEIPPDLETILLKCLQPIPADRYPTTLELAEDLRRFQDGQHIQALPQGRGRRLWNACRRNWPLLAVGAAGLLMVLGLAAWARNAQRRQTRQLELGQYFTLEAVNLEQNLSNERNLPLHDLRPAFAQARARMEALQARVAGMGPEAEGPLHYALGRALFAIRAFPEAQAELEQAWAAGFQTPETAFFLARALSWAYEQACLEAAFHGTAPPPAATQAFSRAEDLFRQAHGLNCDPPEFVDATLAYAQRDYPRAAGLAQASLAANPWHMESATLASLSLSAMAAERAEQGDPGEAENRYRQAQTTAQTALSRGQSEEALHHAQAVAALGLAALGLERGDLPLDGLENLERRTRQTLVLNPDASQAQSDWLRANGLKVMRMMDLGLDPRPDLDEAMQFYWTRTREPRTVDLRVDHMVLYQRQAEQAWAHGQDPWPALTEALRDAGHAEGRHRDFYGDLLNTKARLEAASGQDPRPTAELVLQRFEAPAQARGVYYLCEIAAEAWMIISDAEAKAGQDPLPSLLRAQSLLQRALQGKSTSASAHALVGQTQVMEALLQPRNRSWLLARAQEQLRWAVRLNPADGHNARLRARLEKVPARL